MRQDQYEKLQDLGERLTDVFLAEAEPAEWPGAGLKPGQMDQQTRGDRYWCKKNAAATLSLVQRVAGLVHTIQLAGGTDPAGADGSEAGVADEAAQLDTEIASAEKEAAKLLDELQRRTAKAAFDTRTHGKPAAG